MSHILQKPRLEREIYLEASLIHDPEALVAFLDSSCGDDGQLRTRIMKLLDVTPPKDLFEPDPLIREVIERIYASEISKAATK